MRSVFFENSSLRRLFGIVLVVLALQCTWKLRMVRFGSSDDFSVYSTASVLVREGKGKLIYDGADTGRDPQLLFADPEGIFQRTAHDRGLGRIRMYVYPPLLADIFLPFTYISAAHGAEVWLFLNVAALLLSGLIVLKVMCVPWKSPGGLAMLIGIFGMSGTAQTMVWGQITILLLLLWTAGIYLYQKDLIAASAFMLALGTSIKLTPLIVIIPMLLWRQWRWLLWFTLWVAILLGATCLLNGPATVEDFFFRVAPAMAAGIPHMQNHSIPSVVERLYLTFHGDMLLDGPPFIHSQAPGYILLLGKLLSAALVLAASLFVFFKARFISMQGQVRVVAAFAMLSLLVSPVSWVHAYVLLLPSLAFLWHDALRGLLTRNQVIVLTIGWIETSAIISHAVANAIHIPALRGVLGVSVPLATLALIALMLWDAAHLDHLNGSPLGNSRNSYLAPQVAG